MDTNTDPTFKDVGNIIAGSFSAVVIGSFVIWICIALLAYWVAPEERAAHFFWCTVLLLGPLGVAVALLAQPRKHR